MKYILLTISLLILTSFEGYGQRVFSQSNTSRQILTGGSAKQWKYILKRKSTTCPDDATFHADNIYTFYADQRVEFNNGKVTEAGQCEDLANFEGRWEFSRNMDSLRIIATRRKDGIVLEGTIILDSKILSLSATMIQLEYLEFTSVAGIPPSTLKAATLRREKLYRRPTRAK